MPLLAPPSKIGRVIEGANAQTPVPPANSFESDPVVDPPEPVKEIEGKKAARAAPILAFAERN